MVRIVATLVAGALVVAACTGSDAEADAADDPANPAEPGPVLADETTTTTEPLPPVVLDARPGPFQLTFDQLPAAVSGTVQLDGAQIEAADADGVTIGIGDVQASTEGRSALLRDLPPGEVRLFVVADGERIAAAGTAVIEGTDGPERAFYAAASLEPGFNYLPTRDGTTLSAFVTLPGPVDAGPYPTLIEYSGYAPSRPDIDDPNRLITSALGYALVQVNLRGTGCSGGSFDAFEPIQALDGYDVVETVATQSWSGKVGMYGISYAGIMQLHVAATRPPSLAAIAPLSVLDRIESVLLPGGIYNDGFAETWTEEVSDGAAAFGQGWERNRVDAGDTECERNQRLRVHNPDLVELIRTLDNADDPQLTALTASRSPITVADRIEVPVFLAGAWQDELTGGTWPDLIPALTGAPVVRALLYNGVHGDGVSPEVLAAVTEFYDLYLEDQNPGAGPLVNLGLSTALGAVYGEQLGIDFIRFDPANGDRLRDDYADADGIEVLFEVGAGRPNLPVPSSTATFAQWPPASATPLTLALRSDGSGSLSLRRAAAALDGEASFVTDPDEGERVTASSVTRLITNDPGWDWPRAADTNRLDVTSDRLLDDLVVVGSAGAELWLSTGGEANAEVEVEVEVTLVEVAPDGSETFIQSGWARFDRAAGEPALVEVELPPVAHVFREGSRVRIIIDTPGASRPAWRFDVSDEPTEITVHAGPANPSALTLPVVDGVTVATDRPACGTLRAQPCRAG